MTLPEFLLARIAEDERDDWEIHRQGCATTGQIPFPCDCDYPARVLAECEAKRRIVERHSIDCYVGEGPDGDDEYVCDHCSASAYVFNEVLCPDLLDLALPYADHQDYLPEWRP